MAAALNVYIIILYWFIYMYNNTPTREMNLCYAQSFRANKLYSLAICSFLDQNCHIQIYLTL